MAKKNQESKVEQAKRESRYLRGSIEQVLTQEEGVFEHDDIQALKFHGVYQQDDRDTRQAARAIGGDKAFQFMVRCRIPGGVVTPEQYLALDELADVYTYNRSLRITTRQGFQLHGVLKGQLKPTIANINKTLLSTLAACGDVSRNVMASPAPLADEAHRAVQRLAAEIANELKPKSNAYAEIWLDGEKVDVVGEEPFYGEQYLPRKFKVGIALPEDNSADVYTQDVGLIAVVEDGRVKGVNILVGGGLGMTHRKPDTYARIGTQLGYVDVEHIVDAVRSIAAIFRDHGNRSDRRHARLKYLIEDWGMDRFREEFAGVVDFELKPWVEVGPLSFNDYLGPQPQGDGKFFYGVWVENGRVMDTDKERVKTAFREIVQAFQPTIILTPNQSIIFAGLEEEDIPKLEKILEAYSVRKLDQLTGVRRYSMACPALPTCGLALAESERIMPDIIDDLEQEFERLGVEDEPVTIRMTGCPNGCARPYTADIAFVGRKPDVYDIYVGGHLAGDRLADIYADSVDRAELTATLRPLLEGWARARKAGETLGDFYNRVVDDGQPQTICTGAKDETRGKAEEKLAALTVSAG